MRRIKKEQFACFIIDEKFYFTKRSRMSSSMFIKHFGLKPKSPIGFVFKRLYDYYSYAAINMLSEYSRYYKKEYFTYEKYLKHKHNLSSQEVAIFNNHRAFYKEISKSPERNICNLLEDEKIKRLFYSFWEGTIHEN